MADRKSEVPNFVVRTGQKIPEIPNENLKNFLNFPILWSPKFMKNRVAWQTGKVSQKTGKTHSNLIHCMIGTLFTGVFL